MKSFLLLLILFASSTSSIETAGEVSCQQSIKSKGFEASLQLCTQELHNYQNTEQVDRYFDTAFELYEIYYVTGRRDKAEKLLKEISNREQFANHPKSKFAWNRKVGRKHFYDKDFLNARNYFTKAQDVALDEQNLQWLSKSHNDLALTAQHLGDFEKAIELYKKSLTLKTSLGQEFLAANTQVNLGLLNKKLQRYDDSLKHYLSALESYNQLVSSDSRVITYRHHLYEDLVTLYDLLEDEDAANHYRDLVVASSSHRLSDSELSRSNISLVKSYLKDGLFKKAEPLILALEQNCPANQHRYHPEVNFLKARLMIAKGDRQGGLKLLQGIEPELKNHSDIALKTSFYGLYRDLLLTNNDMTAAYQALNNYHEANLQIVKAQYNETIALTQSEIEKEQVERELLKAKLATSLQAESFNQKVTYGLGLIVVLLMISFAAFGFLYRRTKEKRQLQLIIDSHKQQLELLSGDNLDESKDINHEFRVSLVEMMTSCSLIWGKTTGLDKVELAEQSKIWKVSIDSGRLRTRSMDKYLDLKKLPANPRWKNVVKTCHFVLAREDIFPSDRTELTHKLEQLMRLIKAQSESSV